MCHHVTRRRLLRARAVVSEWPFVCMVIIVQSILYRVPTPPIVHIDNSSFDVLFFTNPIVPSSYLPLPSHKSSLTLEPCRRYTLSRLTCATAVHSRVLTSEIWTVKMWCLVSQPNAVVIEVRLDHKAKGLECLEKVNNTTFFFFV
jgi:hypothetical protein